MSNKGTNLTTNQYLSTNDYLVSSNGVFIALMQSDGNLVIYRGQDAINKTPTQEQGSLWASGSSGSGGQFVALMQGDGNFVIYPGTFAIGAGPTQEHGALWASNSPGPTGEFFVVLQDDGNLVVHAGTPSTSGNIIWQSGATDPVIGCSTITNIAYDLSLASVQNNQPTTLGTGTGTNSTSKQIEYSVDKTIAVTQTSGWSDAIGIQLGVKATYKAQIPIVEAGGRVELSASLTNTFTWNGSHSTTETWHVTAGPIPLQPNETIIATISATTSSVSVPYTLSGILTLQSGARIPGQIKGTYNGVNTWNCTVEFAQGTPSAHQVKRTTVPASISLVSAEAA